MHVNYRDQQDLCIRSAVPRYIVFEGPHYSGKSTLLTNVVDKLPDLGINPERVTIRSFPSRNSVPGKALRDSFGGINKINPKAAAYLYAADLIECEDLLRERYKAGIYSFCDCHPFVSTVVFQSEVYSQELLYGLQQRQQFLKPDRIYILDVPFEVLEERMVKRAEVHNAAFERPDREFQKRVRARYVAYAYTHFENTVLLDGTRSQDELLDQVLTDILRGGMK